MYSQYAYFAVPEMLVNGNRPAINASKFEFETEKIDVRKTSNFEDQT
jgi:hypothetical protein